MTVIQQFFFFFEGSSNSQLIKFLFGRSGEKTNFTHTLLINSNCRSLSDLTPRTSPPFYHELSSQPHLPVKTQL